MIVKLIRPKYILKLSEFSALHQRIEIIISHIFLLSVYTEWTFSSNKEKDMYFLEIIITDSHKGRKVKWPVDALRIENFPIETDHRRLPSSSRTGPGVSVVAFRGRPDRSLGYGVSIC